MIDASVRLSDVRIGAEMVNATINSAEELRRWVPGANVANACDLYVQPLLTGILRADPSG